MTTHGQIELEDDHVFHWSLGKGRMAEIRGHVERPQGGVVKGLSGWYSTEDPEAAAEVAQATLRQIGDCSCIDD